VEKFIEAKKKMEKKPKKQRAKLKKNRKKKREGKRVKGTGEFLNRITTRELWAEAFGRVPGNVKRNEIQQLDHSRCK